MITGPLEDFPTTALSFFFFFCLSFEFSLSTQRNFYAPKQIGYILEGIGVVLGLDCSPPRRYITSETLASDMLRICTSPPEAVADLPASDAIETELETSDNNRQLSSSQNENESETIATSGCVRRIVKSTHLDDHQRAKKTETTVIMPKNLVALADHIDDDEDEEDDNNLEWSPRSAQSIPSLLDDENAAKMARHDRSNSDLTFEPCLDASIIETSQGLFVPHLTPEEDGHAEPAPLLHRCTTPPTIGKGRGKGNADTDITAAATVTPPTTPESSHRSSSMIMQEDSDDADECYGSTTNSSSAKTPKRSNRGKSNNINSPGEIIFNEIQRKKSLQIKNFFRRLAKSVRKG